MRPKLSKLIPILFVAVSCFLLHVDQTQAQTATFIGTDTATEGTWYAATEGTSNVYGADGYEVAQSNSSTPSYATLSVNNQINYTWSSSTSDTRALETGSGSGRIAAAWYNPSSFYLDVNFTDGNTHECAVYALDWDNIGRNETLQVQNASTNALLDTRTISSFTNGIWVIWYITGHVHVTVTTNTSVNAEISGAFFGNGSTSSSISTGLSPLSASLSASGTQSFTATVNGTTNANVAWTLSPSSNSGSISSTGPYTVLYTAPSSLSASQTVNLTSTSVVDTSKSESATITLNAGGGGGGATASFVNTDTSTQGNWKNVYGADGYEIATETPSLPSYLNTFNVVNDVTYVWSSSTTDPRALENPSGSGRSATTWYSTASFYFDIDVGTSIHQFSLYAVDWDSGIRTETITITDATSGNTLDTRTLSGFSNGIYYIWNVSGHVHITVAYASTNGSNAVVSGVFFGGASGGGGAAVSYVKTDTSTQGNWRGAYGVDGYDVATETTGLPSYLSNVSINNASTYTWASSTSDIRALQNVSGSGYSATTWYSASTFYLDVNLDDGNTHQVSVYAVDWDTTVRAATVQISDANSGTVLDTRSISSFHNGLYLVWNISGHVHITVTQTAGANAVISGIFFDPTSGGGGGGGVTVTVNPSTVSLSAGLTQQFNATVTGTGGGTTAVTWSINPPSVGSISTSGLYTAPSTINSPQTVTVTALSQYNNTTTGTAAMDLTQSTNIYYYFEDSLGSSRVITDGSGNIYFDVDYYPFGGEHPPVVDNFEPTYKFNGKERDIETGLDEFGARYYDSNRGRFMIPDWAARPAAVPYANYANPQSLNLYSYVTNNPLSHNDPDGHEVDLLGNDKDKLAEQQRIAANASKTDKNGLKESSLFKQSTDKNGKTTLTLNKEAASKFHGAHSAGYQLLVGAINAKPIITVQMSGFDSYTSAADANGNVSVNLNRNISPIDSISPLRGYDGQQIPNPFSIIAGHEVLGHAYPKIMGWPSDEQSARETENQLRQEQELPLRDPNSN